MSMTEYDTRMGTLYVLPSEISLKTGISCIPDGTKQVYKKIRKYLVEDVRTARRFISSLKLGLTIEELEFEIINKKTKFEDLQELMSPLLNGEDMGVMSEAGCPGIADPGALAVEFAHQFNIRVVTLVGPSSILLALMGSGLNGQSFTFHGYIPIDKTSRIKRIKELEKLSLKLNQTQIFIETPYRNEALFNDIVKTCQNATRLTVACDLTGENELLRTWTIGTWKKQKPDIKKRPTVFLIHA